MTKDDEIAVYRLTEARVLTPRDGRDLVILAIKSGTETTHYGMSLADLCALAERLSLDALMLGQIGDPMGSA